MIFHHRWLKTGQNCYGDVAERPRQRWLRLGETVRVACDWVTETKEWDYLLLHLGNHLSKLSSFSFPSRLKIIMFHFRKKKSLLYKSMKKLCKRKSELTVWLQYITPDDALPCCNRTTSQLHCIKDYLNTHISNTTWGWHFSCIFPEMVVCWAGVQEAHSICNTLPVWGKRGKILWCYKKLMILETWCHDW